MLFPFNTKLIRAKDKFDKFRTFLNKELVSLEDLFEYKYFREITKDDYILRQ